MDSVDSVRLGANITQQTLSRFIPEPKTRSSLSFGSVMGSVGSALAGTVGAYAGIDPAYQELINQQIAAQVQMQLVSLESNLEKSKHETQMAPIRNIRVG